MRGVEQIRLHDERRTGFRCKRLSPPLRRWRPASLPALSVGGLLEEFQRFPLRAAAANQKRLTPSFLGDEIPVLHAQAGGKDLASYFAPGLAPPSGLARERAGEVGVDANREHGGSLPCSAHCPYGITPRRPGQPRRQHRG